MTHFPTCTGCAVDRSSCSTLTLIKRTIVGFRFTSVRHKCAFRIAQYILGTPVWVKTCARRGPPSDPDYGDGPPIFWYPGVFIEQKETKGIAFIHPGSLGEGGGEDERFETDGIGYVKVPLSRIRPRPEGEPMTRDNLKPCRLCGDIPVLSGCGQPPDYPGQRRIDCLEWNAVPVAGEETT